MLWRSVSWGLSRETFHYGRRRQRVSRVGRVMKYAATTLGEFVCPDCGCVLAADACELRHAHVTNAAGA
ncbi:MAG: hypothetical protein ACLTQI_08015 [Slackia sp.]